MLVTPIAMISVIARVAGSFVFADFFGGLLHFVEDRLLEPGHNRLLDRFVIEPNREHHRLPGLIRNGTYWETNAVSIGIATALAALCALAGIRVWEIYFTLLIGSQSNQFHAWAHTSRPPWLVGFLQTMHVLQSPRHHGRHHRDPFNIRYCTTTPWLNPLLDGIHFWRTFERAVRFASGGRLAQRVDG